MNFNPKVMFWVGVGGTLAYAVGQGTVSFTNALPETWIPVVVAWNKILGFAVMSFQTAAAGFHDGGSSSPGPMVKLLG